MGTDIHLHVEKKVKGKWVPAQGLLKDEDGDPYLPLPDELYSERNYLLFGFLAGVRFEEVQHFAVKGFPTDASPEITKIFEKWGPDAHTPSYLTFEELNSVDWDNYTIKCFGYVAEEYQEIFERELAKPIHKRNYLLIEALNYYPDDINGKHCEWDAPIRYAFREFYEKVVEDLFLYLPYWDYEEDEDGEDFDPSNVRIVFWFDN
jgi:hypothetical protein